MVMRSCTVPPYLIDLLEKTAEEAEEVGEEEEGQEVDYEELLIQVNM